MKRVWMGAALLAVLLLPWVGNNYVIRLATIMLMYSVLALSWNLIGGTTGYPSFATAAFFGLGAYAGAVSQVHGVPMGIAWMIGGLVAALFALGLGLAILHLRGHYFAIASLIAVEVLREMVNSATSVTGGGMGLTLPVLRLGVNEQARLFYYSVGLIALLTLAAAAWVRSHRLGFGLNCIKQNENAARMIGINTTIYKTLAFVLSAVFAGFAGAFNASWVNYIEPGDVFDVLLSIKPIVMVLLGGATTLFGPLLGAVIYLFLEETVWRNLLTIHSGVLGILVVLIILFRPDGLFTFKIPRPSAGKEGR
jgi:branched-chain amino acid transport system permease protein